MPRKIEISHRTIIFTVLFLVALFLLFQIRQILLTIFLSVILMTALNPSVDRLEKFKVPRFLAILLLYFFILGIFSGMIAGVVPPLIDQTTTLVTNLPERIHSLGLPMIDQGILADQLNQIGSIPTGILRLSISLFSNLLGVFFILVITFYLLAERRDLNKYLIILFGGDGEKKAERFVDELEKKLGGWVRAELLLMFIIGVFSYIGLRLLGIDYALPLAIVAGILELIPNIGPVISAIPAILTGMAISPLMGVATAALYFLIHQLENSLIVPLVMKREVGINPLVTILALAVGFKLSGVIGAVLAVPIVLLIRIILVEFFPSEKLRSL